MVTEWFCQVMGSEVGPLSQRQLVDMVRQHQVNPEDLVRRNDSSWVPAFEVKGLFEAASKPPSTQPDKTSPKSTSQREEASSRSELQQAKQNPSTPNPSAPNSRVASSAEQTLTKVQRIDADATGRLETITR